MAMAVRKMRPHDDQPGQDCEQSPIPEPPERPRQQFLHDAALGSRIGLFHERNLDDVEVVEEPDPGDARKEVNPPHQQDDKLVSFEFHIGSLGDDSVRLCRYGSRIWLRYTDYSGNVSCCQGLREYYR